MPDAVLLIATGRTVLRVDPRAGSVEGVDGLEKVLPTSLAADPSSPGIAWCGTTRGGVFRSADAGVTWQPSGLAGTHITALSASPCEPKVVWAGTEPSAIWRSPDGGARWEPTTDLLALPSSPEWSFPPKPETHHVRWIACHPSEPGRLWAAIEAGALIRTNDGGASWVDRVPGGPYDTHELSIHPDRPQFLRAAAGDGFFESVDGGERWTEPREGLEVGYFRSVAIDPGDPELVLASAATRPRSAYVAGHADGRLYRRIGADAWVRVTEGWPDPPSTIAPLIRAGSEPGELWASDERGVHRSGDGGRSWERIAAFPDPVGNLRGMIVLTGGR